MVKCSEGKGGETGEGWYKWNKGCMAETGKWHALVDGATTHTQPDNNRAAKGE